MISLDNLLKKNSSSNLINRWMIFIDFEVENQSEKRKVEWRKISDHSCHYLLGIWITDDMFSINSTSDDSLRSKMRFKIEHLYQWERLKSIKDFQWKKRIGICQSKENKMIILIFTEVELKIEWNRYSNFHNTSMGKTKAKQLIGQKAPKVGRENSFRIKRKRCFEFVVFPRSFLDFRVVLNVTHALRLDKRK